MWVPGGSVNENQVKMSTSLIWRKVQIDYVFWYRRWIRSWVKWFLAVPIIDTDNTNWFHFVDTVNLRVWLEGGHQSSVIGCKVESRITYNIGNLSYKLITCLFQITTENSANIVVDFVHNLLLGDVFRQKSFYFVDDDSAQTAFINYYCIRFTKFEMTYIPHWYL